MSAPRVVAILSDFMFKAKLSAVASRTGATLRFAATPADAERAAREVSPDLVLVDLHHGDALSSVAALRKVGSPRVVGFYSHVDAATREAALGANVEPMARSKFVVELPTLLGG